MSGKIPKILSAVIVIFAVLLIAFMHFSKTEPTEPKNTSSEPFADNRFSAPEPTEEPQTGRSSGAVSTSYEPVYPITISQEAVREPVTLHHLVPEKYRQTYVYILDKLKNREKEIVLPTPVGSDDFAKTLVYVRDLNPDLFFVDWSIYNYKADSLDMVTDATFRFFDGLTSADSEAFEKQVQSIVSRANQLPNMFERELFIHDYLINNTAYLVDDALTGCAYGAIMGHEARCEGYARAFQLLMLRVGAPALSVIGNSENERHMWNAVDLYGKYYFVDVTFDDDSAQSGITALNENEISHSCFNIPLEILSRTHTVSASGSVDRYGSYQNLILPDCTSYDFNYYRVRGFAVKNFSQFKYVLEKAVPEKRASVFFEGEMPSSEELKTEFDSFFREKYSTGGYSIYYSPESSPVYKRNVYEISWTSG